MRNSKAQKISSTTLNKQLNKQINAPIKYSFHNYMNLTNQQYLIHSLKLLGITEDQYMKQTKLSMEDQIFGKTQSATTSKSFFFIVITILKYLASEEQLQSVKMWYPPRTVNEQLEFKKATYNLICKLQTKNKIPKQLLISKTFLMGQTPSSKIIQFLRILTQLALRAQYLQKYSKNERLIDICLNEIEDPQKQPNDINRFFIYPFAPGQQNSNPPLQLPQIQSLKSIFKTHIQIYRKKILSLAGKFPKEQLISCQQLMSNLVQQKQLDQKLSKKIPKSVLSDNRAFDRRKIIDKSKHVWEQLYKLQCHHIQVSENQPILKLQGQIDKILLKWETSSGINKMMDACKMTEKLNKLRQGCGQTMQQYSQFRQRLHKELKKYQK